MKSIIAVSLVSVCCLAAICADDPLILKPTDDTFLTEDHTGKPAGRGEKNEVQIYGAAGKKPFRALLKFDLKDVTRPPSAAILRIYAWNLGSIKKTELIRCHALVRDWSEKHASWDMSFADDQWVNPGSDWDPTPIAGNQIGTKHGGENGLWLDFDVTALVQAWVLKRRMNFGFVLMLDGNSDAEIRCRSKDNGSNQPELKLAWAAKLDRGPGMVMGDKIKPFGDPVKLEPVWTAFSIPILKAGQALTHKLTAKGGVRPYKFTSGALPEGLTLAEDGTLSGSSSKLGKFNIQFTCTGADGKRATKTLTLEIQPADVPAADKDEKKEEKKDEKKAEKKVEEE